MGIWSWVSSATEQVKQNAPDLAAVTNICRNACTAVTVNGTETVKGYLPGSEGREKIKRIATDVAVPEFLRYTGIPGAAQTFRIIWGNPSSSSLHDNKKYEEELSKVLKKCEELEEEVEIIKHDNKMLSEQCRRLELQNNVIHRQSEVIQNPEEVIIDFMMNGFKGRDLLGHLIVPSPKDGYPKKP